MPVPTIAEAARRIAAREISPVELTRHCLEAAEAANPTLAAFIRLDPGPALDAAHAAEARAAAGTLRGPLDGIPIAHKDIYATKGIPTTAHSRLLEHFVPDADATTVRTLAEAGAVSIGKLATHEFAFGGPSFDLPFPPARNPWQPEHFTAGSSSGTGAAVAAGLILGGTGSDTAGSIRGPAALCGIAGLKPTYGLCPRTGILPLAFSLDHAGPMAWTVEDCALLLAAMAGHDPADPASADRPIPDYAANLGAFPANLRVGVVRRWHETDHRVEPSTQAGLDRAIAVLRDAGATVDEVELAPLHDFQAATYVIMVSEAFALHEPWMRERFGDYGELLRHRMVFGGLFSATDHIQALRRRRELCVETARRTRDFDLLLTAAAPGEAPRIDSVPKWAHLEKPGFTAPFNLLGWPAISVPTGLGPAGLPIAVQLAAKPFDEPTLLRAAHAVEAALSARTTRPPPIPA